MSNAQELTLVHMVGKQWAAKTSLEGLPGYKVAGLLLGDPVKGVMVGCVLATNGHVCKTFNKIEFSGHIMIAPLLIIKAPFDEVFCHN